MAGLPARRPERMTGRGALAAALVLLGLGAASATEGPRRCAADTVTLLTGEEAVRFRVELARTPSEQARGLMYRPQLDADAGMLFIYDPPRQARFWMKNTMIPLDMLFIVDTGRVESVAARTVPYSRETHASDGAVRAVLEINGGMAADLGIGPGTQAVHPAFRAAPEAHRCPALD